MFSPIPLVDLAGYKRRTKVNPNDIDVVEAKYPGFIGHRIAGQTARINARLKKRYAVPLGQNPPLLVAQGTTPPPVTLIGRPTVGSVELAMQITTAGALGVAIFAWSGDGGVNPIGSTINPPSWTTGVLTAATVPLAGTGLSALFPAGTYGSDNVFAASSPVPEIAILWLVSLVDVDVWQRRGANPQDPIIAMGIAERDRALDELKEAADSKEGLFDLPTNDGAGDSAVTQGGPMSYSEQSPFVWADQQQQNAIAEDQAKTGTSGSSDTP